MIDLFDSFLALYCYSSFIGQAGTNLSGCTLATNFKTRNLSGIENNFLNRDINSYWLLLSTNSGNQLIVKKISGHVRPMGRASTFCRIFILLCVVRSRYTLPREFNDLIFALCPFVKNDLLVIAIVLVFAMRSVHSEVTSHLHCLLKKPRKFPLGKLPCCRAQMTSIVPHPS